jgi:hypothetical protein
MERTKKEEPVSPGRLRFKKIGGGSAVLVIAGKKIRIKPGEIFRAFQYEIPQQFRDIIIPLDAAIPVSPEPKIVPSKTTYKVQPRGKSKSMFDVVDSQGKLINDKSKPLAKEVAEQLVKDLEK